MITRRDLFTGAAALAGAAVLDRTARAAGAATDLENAAPASDTALRGEPGKDYKPVITPNNIALPYRVVDGVKVFHLIAEEVRNHEFAPGLKAHCWGFNGRVHGPTLEAVEGDRVRISVTNKLAEPTSIHWHAIILPSGMDGVSGLSQKPIQTGETFKYEFTLRQHGTFMYHSHLDMTEMGMKAPRNSLPMVGSSGPHGYIDMGGMFAILKVRENLAVYDDPGWYQSPPGTQAELARNEDLQRDLGAIPVK